MATAKKLPSGNWRCLVYSHTEKGKRIYESFTAPTKQQAEMQAAKYANSKKRNTASGVTVQSAIEGYITAKTNVLSPSTVRSYRGMQKKYYKDIGKIQIQKLTNEDIQLMISDLTEELSPKTIKNIYALLTAAISFYSSDIHFNVDLPQSIKKKNTAPNNEDIKVLLKLASPWMLKCISLAAFGGLRRGEIAALKYKDIIDNTVCIHADMVMDENNKWIYKDMPKNQTSIRLVEVPPEVIKLIGNGKPDDNIIKYNPNTISKMFIKLRNRAGINIRFHDLRHYYASIGAYLGVPDIVMADFGGWRHDSPIMKTVYQGNISTISEEYSKKINSYFSELLKQ